MIPNKSFSQPSGVITVVQQAPPQYTMSPSIQNGFNMVPIQNNQDLHFPQIMSQNLPGIQPFMIPAAQPLQSNGNPIYIIPVQVNPIYNPVTPQMNFPGHFIPQQKEMTSQNKGSSSLEIINKFLRNKTSTDKNLLTNNNNNNNDLKAQIGSTVLRPVIDLEDTASENKQDFRKDTLQPEFGKETSSNPKKEDEIVTPLLQERSEEIKIRIPKRSKIQEFGMTTRRDQMHKSQIKREKSSLRTRNKWYIFEGKGDKKKIIAKPRMSFRSKIQTAETPIIYIMSSIKVGSEHQAEIPKMASDKKEKVKRELNLKWSPQRIEEPKLLTLRNDLEEILNVKVSCEKIIELLTTNGNDSEKVLGLVKNDIRGYNKFFRIKKEAVVNF